MKAPLYDKIMEYGKNITSFHMPGHKFGGVLNMGQISPFDLDVTEVPGLDNLYEAEGVILEAQRKMAMKYGAKDTIFITNGSTSGIIASILAVCKPGDSLIVARNCHHSVWNALILGGVQPIYINPSYDEDYNILGGICTSKLEQTLISNPEVKGVIIVSPTYEGFVSDIEGISNIVHKYSKILIVDEAHGAHFIWDKIFPKSAVQCGADLVIQSMHKTLPAITQSALLHIGSDKIDKQTLIQRLQMIQTSSPSYIMMALMDYIRAEMEEKENLWTDYIREILKVRKRLMKLQNLLILSKDICGKVDIYDMDISKIVIYTYNTQITGVELGEILRSNYSIQVEVEAEEYIIAMSTIGDTSYDLGILCEALLEIDSKLKQGKIKKRYVNMIDINNKNNNVPREIYFADKEYIPIEKSKGRISATNIMLYPPGIPLICIGEVFSKKMIHNMKDFPGKLLGIINEKNNIKVLVSKDYEKERTYEG